MTEGVTHEDILRRVEDVEKRLFDGDKRFAVIGDQVTSIKSDLRDITESLKCLPAMQADLAANTATTHKMSEMVEAWSAISGNTATQRLFLTGSAAGGTLFHLWDYGPGYDTTKAIRTRKSERSMGLRAAKVAL